jgi:hypothetical protein
MRNKVAVLALASLLVASVLGARNVTAGEGDAKIQAILKVAVSGMS